MYRHLIFALALSGTLTLPVLAQDSNSQDKPFDVRSSVGDMHVGKDASAEKQGLPLYPGARARRKNLRPVANSFNLCSINTFSHDPRPHVLAQNNHASRSP